MTYISLNYYILVLVVMLGYYIMPLNCRWIALLVGNICFYMLFYKTGWWIFLLTIIVSYVAGLLIKYVKTRKKIIWILGLTGIIMPWFFIRNGNFIFQNMFNQKPLNWIVPLGISFYTLQLVAYITDIYTNKIDPEKNFAKFILFSSFFPQIIQGPISRYDQIGKQLAKGHKFDENKVVKGFCYIIWGFFLKLVIADKAAVIVNLVFDNYPAYSGIYMDCIGFIQYSIICRFFSVHYIGSRRY